MNTTTAAELRADILRVMRERPDRWLSAGDVVALLGGTLPSGGDWDEQTVIFLRRVGQAMAYMSRTTHTRKVRYLDSVHRDKKPLFKYAFKTKV